MLKVGRTQMCCGKKTPWLQQQQSEVKYVKEEDRLKIQEQPESMLKNVRILYNGHLIIFMNA